MIVNFERFREKQENECRTCLNPYLFFIKFTSIEFNRKF